MPKFVDQMGRVVPIDVPPKRIVSLVPSQTELLYDLGLRDEVIGITRFCIHPTPWHRNKTRIGGTKQYHFDKIAKLKPDLIIGNKEENDKTQIEALMDQYPVWMSDIFGLEDAYEMILQIGQIVGKEESAQALVEQTRSGFSQFNLTRELRVVYLIWHEPIMAAANETFIQEMITQCGWRNCLADQKRYPQLTIETLRSLEPNILFLSSEPFPFKEKHLEYYRSHLPNTAVRLVDGEAFSWYGSRLLKSQTYLQGLINSVPEEI